MVLTELIDKLKEYLAYNPKEPLMFNSGPFLFMFLIFLGLYIALVNRKTLRVVYILAFSLFFYYKSSGIFYLLLLVSTVIDYTLGFLIYIYHPGHKHIVNKQIFPGIRMDVIDLSHEFTVIPRKGLGVLYNFLTDLSFRFLTIFITLLDRLINRFISPEKESAKRKFYLILSIVANLGLLAYFKYTHFFIDTLNTIGGFDLSFPNIFLPVGISFYTFQTMSYSIDIYRKKLAPVMNVLDFAFFVSFFPQLVAGPIVRATDFIPQIRETIRVSYEDIGRGFLLISTGLFKKAVISDYISINFVDRVFEDPTLYTGFENLMGVYGYALQIYCDFSGYSDMAIGLGLLMGFTLPVNFNAPYQSTSIQEFWRRWHISLSTWLRDYLYISLGGNRRGKFRTYLNLLVTMVLGGLWHGASWKFVFWGFLHGIALALDRVSQDIREYVSRRFVEFMDWLDQRALLKEKGTDTTSRLGEVIRQIQWFMQGWVSLVLSVVLHLGGVFFTFHFVCFCWIFFRAQSFAMGWEMIAQIMYNFQGQIAWQVLTGYREVFLLMLLGYILHFLPDEVDGFVERRFITSPMIVKSVALALVIWMVVQTRSADIQPFIYYQF